MGDGAMPKETISDEAAMYDITVGWSAGQWVQVGVASTDGRAIVDKLIASPADEPMDEARTAKVRATVDELTGSGALAAFTSLWGTLDRAGCNRLIQVLRRARDQAYGRDE